jgi:hypothetical protein
MIVVKWGWAGNAVINVATSRQMTEEVSVLGGNLWGALPWLIVSYLFYASPYCSYCLCWTKRIIKEVLNVIPEGSLMRMLDCIIQCSARLEGKVSGGSWEWGMGRSCWGAYCPSREHGLDSSSFRADYHLRSKTFLGRIYTASSMLFLTKGRRYDQPVGIAEGPMGRLVHRGLVQPGGRRQV